MRVVFLGTPPLAVPTLRALALSRDLKPLAVYTQPAARRSRRGGLESSPVGKAAKEFGIACHEVQSVNTGEALESLQALVPDVLVVVAFGQILRRVVLSLPRFGCVNFHPSMLPAYRGAAPVQRAVMDGVVDSGLSIMRLVRKLDAGPVLLQKPWRMDPERNAEELLEEAGELGAPMMLETLRLLRGGLNAVAQDDTLVSYAPPLERADGELRFDRDARTLHNRVRGVQPWPRGEAWLEREKPVRVLVHSTAVGDAQGTPGEIVGITRDGIAVGCEDGSLMLKTIQLDGKPPRAAWDVANGLRLKTGERFRTEAWHASNQS